jgi:hypothetical protein
MDDDTILNHLMNISNDLGSINSKLDNVIESMKNHVKEDKDIHDGQEIRIKSLENSQNRLKWMAAGAAAIGAALWKVFELIFSSGSHN